MTNLPSGSKRTAPMTGSLDGFSAELQTALARLDRERRSSFARPGQRAEATDRFMRAVEKAVERVRGSDRVNAAAIRAADLDTAKRDHGTIAALQRQLGDTVAEAAQLREALGDAHESTRLLRLNLTGAQDGITELAAELAEARHTITELQGEMATHEQTHSETLDALAELKALPQRVRPDATPEVTLEAPAPPLPRRHGPGSRSRKAQDAAGAATHTPVTPSTPKPAGGRTAPRRTTTEG